MFNNIRYGLLPYEIQIMILKMGLEHPIAKIIKKTIKDLPIPIDHNPTFSELFFTFYLDLKKLNFEKTI
tara:strand:+ start:987 stop:1193 length:207 start_codon:yes stop_codon:yes gene_type:complete